MALSRTPPSPGSTGWFPVARAADVGGVPLAVGAGGRPWLVVRLRPGAEVTALSPRCPHRLVPLTAGTVVGGRLQCASHGWEFNAEGRCVDIPALGADGTPPPRADLTTPWAVEERDGWVWIAPERTLHSRPPRAVAGTTADPVPPLPEPAGPVFGNLEPALEHAWHPVALTDELVEGGWLGVRLLGRTWTLERTGGAVTVEPAAWGVRERWGVVWVAPAEPRATDLPLPEADDPRVTATWLTPTRTSAPGGPVLDALLPAVAAPVHAEDGGFGARWDDGQVAVRTPFQLVTRTDDATGTTLHLLQPEDPDSTRVYTCVLLRAAEGALRVPRSEVAAAVASAQAALARALAVQELAESSGLPLTLREELHVPTDALGVALRRALGDHVVATRSPELGSPELESPELESPELEEDTDVAA